MKWAVQLDDFWWQINFSDSEFKQIRMMFTSSRTEINTIYTLFADQKLSRFAMNSVEVWCWKACWIRFSSTLNIPDKHYYVKGMFCFVIPPMEWYQECSRIQRFTTPFSLYRTGLLRTKQWECMSFLRLKCSFSHNSINSYSHWFMSVTP